MKKMQKPVNVRPPKSVCEKCRSHGCCLAEDGKPGYVCTGLAD